MPTIDIQRACQTPDIPADAQLTRFAGLALADCPEAEVVLRIVDEAEGRALNRRYRDQDQATNVLSFAADLPPQVDLPLLGDVVICAPVVAREAAEQGKPPENHWAHLVVHGILHLRGHDHISEAQAEAMEALEKRLLHQLGIPDPYAVVG